MTITLTREEAQQVLDALNSCDETWVYDGEFEQVVDQYDHKLVAKALETLRARLAQPEPEPVAWIYNGKLHEFDPSDWAEGDVTPLYTAPPQREWQGLTDEERYLGDARSEQEIEYAKTIEAKLKEKNT